MESFFYERTAYCLLSIPVPRCFTELDKCFDARFTGSDVITRQPVMLAENLCRRMADVEYYAQSISEVQKSSDASRAATLIGTLLVGYFVACKSLSDAGAITLANLYDLPLTNKEMDFSKEKFWRKLKESHATVHDRYMPFKDLFKEIVKWRDAAVHRLTPFVVPHSPGKPWEAPREEVKIQMVAQPDADVRTVVKLAKTKNIPWVEPLYYHRKWQNQLIKFCKEVCLDIRDKTAVDQS